MRLTIFTGGIHRLVVKFVAGGVDFFRLDFMMADDADEVLVALEATPHTFQYQFLLPAGDADTLVTVVGSPPAIELRVGHQLRQVAQERRARATDARRHLERLRWLKLH